MPTVDSAIRMAKVMSSEPDHLADQHLDRRRQLRGAAHALVEEVAGRGRQPQGQDQQHRRLDDQQRRDAQAADHDGDESSAAMVGCSRPRMLSAAMVQAEIATRR